MKPGHPGFKGNPDEEISALISTLRETGQRLELLTGGEVDSVVDRSGRTLLLRGVHEQLQQVESGKQAAILSALPAHIALLDQRGFIMAVNDAWRRFAIDNQLHQPGHAVGVNYLDVCDAARGDASAQAHAVAAGIRSVLDGSATSYSFEYSCHSPPELRWYQMRVTPLPGNPPAGAVVMHMNVTGERTSELGLRESEQRFEQMATSIEDVFFLQSFDGSKMYYVSPAYERIWGRSCESLYADPQSWAIDIHPDDRPRVYEQFRAGQSTGFDYEFRILRPDAGVRWVHVRGFPILDDDGNPYRTAGIASDVTRQKGAEEKQRATALLLDNIVENIPSAVQVKSVQDNFRIELWNKAAAAMYGVPSAEAIGKDVHALWPQADADRMHAADLDLVATGRMQDFPDRLAQTRLRGDIRVHMRKVALLDADGKATHLLVVADDMTAEQAAQARLRDSEARFRSLSMLSSDWFWEQDADHRFIHFSGGGGIKGWGPDQDKAVGLHRWDLGGVVPITSSWAEHKALLDAHQPFRKFEYQRILDDGRLQYVEASGEPVFDAAGRFSGYRGVASEITDRKQAERELQRFRAAMDSSGDAIVLVDRSSMRYIDVNQTLCDMVGYTRDELIGMTPMELFGADRQTLERDYDAIIGDRHCAAARVEGHYRTKAGMLIPIETRRRAMQADGGWIIVGAARDITGQRLSEHKIQRLNRVYAMLSGINALIVRAGDRAELFRDACRIAVEVGQFSKVWLGVVEPGSRQLTIAAAVGGDPLFFEELAKGLAEKFRSGQGLVARALSTRQPVVSNDSANDPEVLMKQYAGQASVRSIAILPLIVSGATVGVFTLNADAPDFFDSAEMQLLTQLADDIAHAIDHIDKAEKLARFTRINAMLSGVNGAIVRIHDRRKLFQEVCRIAVETGGLPFAWVGVVNESRTRLRPVASAGAGGNILAAIKDRLLLEDGAPGGFGVAASAVREKRAVTANDIEASDLVRHKQAYAALGTRSMASLPLMIGDKVMGAFTLDATEVGFFDDDEMALLKEMAGNIAFAVEHMEKEAQVRRLTRVYSVLSGINRAIVRIRNPAELYREACRIAVAEGGFILARVVAVDADGMTSIAATTESDASLFQGLLDAYNADHEASGILIGLAIRDGQPLISNDVAGDPRMPNRAALTRDGNYALALLPVTIDNRVVSVIILRARDAGSFNDNEMRLLRELVSNLSFALDLMDKRNRIEYLAYHDDLTGLPNRHLFLEQITDQMRIAAGGGRQMAVFVIDLERFKNINDSLGRAAGDVLLKQVAQWIAAHKAANTLVARLGADVFGVLLPDVGDEQEAARRLEQQMTAFAGHPYHLKDAVFRIAVKVGAAMYPADGQDAETLLRNGEAALKHAKARGERSLFHTPAMTAMVARNLSLENHLREAIAKDEFVLHYQPKVDLRSGLISGAEALIRWNDPRTGLVAPGHFIPMLEETGLIYEVGRWALRKAIEDYLRWRAAGLRAVRIAVNVSPLQLRSRSFVAEIGKVTGVDAGAAAGLELEITESLIMEDVKHSIASLQAIRALGVTIAIDDFGTGFSSLSYLAKLPADTLKIDRSFVAGMTAGPQGLSLVSTIISLAHSLNLKVVAEGVETEEQSRLLKLLRCEEMQGFLFSKPVPVADFEARFLLPAAAPARVP